MTKAVENVGQKLRRHALARIADEHLNAGINSLQLNPHTSSARRELNGVRDEIPRDLLQAVGIAHHLVSGVIQSQLQVDFFGLCRRAQTINSDGADGVQVNWLQVQAQLAGHDAGNIEQIFNELRLHSRVATNDLDSAPVFSQR